MLTSLCLNKNQERVSRDTFLPLTRVTLLCGPNGSGKSTVIDALDELINGSGTSKQARQWTAETAPVLVEGRALAVMIFSMEKDNLRRLDGGDLSSAKVMRKIWASERSHGQSNFSNLQDMFDHPGFDVMVLDEPESALDLDGLLWLREKLLETEKQVILATHSALLLSLSGDHEVSVLTFGENDYHTRVLAAFEAVCARRAIPKAKVRLVAFADAPATAETESDYPVMRRRGS